MKKKWVTLVLKILYGHTCDERLSQEVCGMTFDNPVGLAAGFDKGGNIIDAMDAIGFGCVEVGTIVPRPQPGNPRPRIFRLIPEKGIINRMGFNSAGVDTVVENLAHRRRKKTSMKVGISVGKNMNTALAEAAGDHHEVISRTIQDADYFVVNISSPNTPGLRDLQNEQYIHELLTQAKKSVAIVALEKDVEEPPLGVKISPDMNPAEIKVICTAAQNVGINFIIATNTTINHGNDIVKKYGKIAGGLSGDPLFERALITVHIVATLWDGPIIAVGGIDSAARAIEMLHAGATLIQFYTGFIYQGPGLVRKINDGIAAYMEKEGMQHISDFHKTEVKDENSKR